jgi:serine/threonine-protein kinase
MSSENGNRRPPGTEDVEISSLLRGLHASRSQPPQARERPPGVPGPGELIDGKYVVEHVLGTGGMGVVLAARHAQLGQRVAIKFMQGKAARDPNAVGRFLREARAAAALSNEHVAKVHDVGTLETGEPYLIMEYLSGVDLKQVLRRSGPMAVSDAVGAVLQACEGITEAHAMGIVHRDLKPSNLFVTQRMDGTPLVKVLDFGISKVTDANAVGTDQSLTPSGSVMGSPQYMSPEQVRNAKDVDARSDIWALGVILYELLVGVPPFAGETLGSTLAKILSESPAPIGGRRPDVPQQLAAAVFQCLERDLKRRVQNVGELATKLMPYASREATLSAERILRVQRASGAPQPKVPTVKLAVVAGAPVGTPAATATATPVVVGGTSQPATGATPTGGAMPAGSAVPAGSVEPVRESGPPGGEVAGTESRASAPAPAAAQAAEPASATPEGVGETASPWLRSDTRKPRRGSRAVVIAAAGVLLLAGAATTLVVRGRSRQSTSATVTVPAPAAPAPATGEPAPSPTASAAASAEPSATGVPVAPSPVPHATTLRGTGHASQPPVPPAVAEHPTSPPSSASAAPPGPAAAAPAPGGLDPFGHIRTK